jgi:phosphoribosylaminoimidazolecarboxamide formyltransferase/IMP cyclohydrolase
MRETAAGHAPADGRVTVRRALVSVWDKTGVVDLAKAIHASGAEIISTGGTAEALAAAGLPVMTVEALTGYPPILDGRVKTLHPAVFGAILARDLPAHQAQLRDLGIAPLDLVVVNLYPFEAMARNAPPADAAELIDIGGVTLLRAAAKNWERVAVVCDPSQYQAVAAELRATGGLSATTRRALAAAAFARTAAYDSTIAAYFADLEGRRFPDLLTLAYRKVQETRYGENPHQAGAFYRAGREPEEPTVAWAKVLQGKELSYNNILDLDSAWRLVTELDEPACVIVKHNNPCGTALGKGPEEAYGRAWACDPVSAFGGIVAFNRRLDAATARRLAEVFVEAVIAPGYEAEAKQAFGAKKNLRVMDMDTTSIHKVAGFDLRRVMGGLLVQEFDLARFDRARCETVTKRKPSEEEWKALGLAWTVAKHVKSNAIVFANATQTVGVGAGQMSRVDSARIASLKAQLPLEGTAAASDAFFPFRDGLDEIAKAGATSVIQPGGSVRDEEVIAAADEHGLAMVFTGVRHFRH